MTYQAGRGSLEPGTIGATLLRFKWDKLFDKIVHDTSKVFKLLLCAQVQKLKIPVVETETVGQCAIVTSVPKPIRRIRGLWEVEDLVHSKGIIKLGRAMVTSRDGRENFQVTNPVWL